MNADAILTAVVALCCVAAIGTTATTLDSTVSTDPDDVVDVEREDVPVGVEQAKQLDEAINGGEESPDGSESSRGGEPSDSGDPQQGSEPGEEGDASRSQADSNEMARDEASGSDGGREQKQEQKQKQDAASKSVESPPEPDPLDRLLSLLRTLLDAMLAALPVALLLVAAAAAFRFRDRLRPYADRLLPGAASDDAGPFPTPQNDVAAAWFEMVDRLGLADRQDLTPRECTEVARREGVDADAAATLTALFEEVRYGGARVTDERRRRARRSIRRIRAQLEVRG